MRRPVGRVVRDIVRRTIAQLRGHDVWLISAGAALYGALAIAPSLLVAIKVSSEVLGEERMNRFTARLADSLPTAQGADDAVVTLVEAGQQMTLLAAVFAVLASTAYGIGLRRALVRTAPAVTTDRTPSWKLRLLTLPLLGLAPLLVTGLVVSAPLIADLTGDTDWWGQPLAVFVALNVVWALTWAPLTWMYRVVGPGRPSWGSAFVGAMIAGAFVSGFLQGFVVFLALPIDLGRPFGGLVVIGLASGVLLWLWVLHVVVALGYTVTWILDGRRRPVDADDPPPARDSLRNDVPLSGSTR